jgi:hypothetical protein
MRTGVNSDSAWQKTVSTSRRFGIAASIAAILASCGGGGASIGQPRQLIALAVQPSPASAVQGGTVTFQATGTFDQAPTTQSNLPVQWASSDSSVVTIDPGTGIATCVVVGGPINITASAAGKGGMVAGSGTLTCRVRSNGAGQCEVNSSTNTLTGSCLGPDPQLLNHCRVATDDANCPPGQPATSPVWTTGCFPRSSAEIDTATVCSN